MLPTNVLNYIVSETARQQSEDAEPMINAYKRICEFEGVPITELQIVALANCFGFSGYRITPVTFSSGIPALSSKEVPDAMKRLVEHQPPLGDFDVWFDWIKAFLDIHPFEDGNGRVASLLFNWGMFTLESPIPLPYYNFP